MTYIRAIGTAFENATDKSGWDDQEVNVYGDERSISRIEFGIDTWSFIKDLFMEKINHPVDMLIIPYTPQPNTMHAALAAVRTMWPKGHITIEGEIEPVQMPNGPRDNIRY